MTQNQVCSQIIILNFDAATKIPCLDLDETECAKIVLESVRMKRDDWFDQLRQQIQSLDQIYKTGIVY